MSKKKYPTKDLSSLIDSVGLLRKLAQKDKIKLCCLVHTHEMFHGRPFCRNCTKKLIKTWTKRMFEDF